MDTETTIYNTKVASANQIASTISYTCPDCSNEVALDHEALVDCTCGLMCATDSCIVNDKVQVSVKNEKSIKVNLITTVGLLRSCYGQHGTIKPFAKSILTRPLNICYNNVELKVLPVKKADKNKD